MRRSISTEISEATSSMTPKSWSARRIRPGLRRHKGPDGEPIVEPPTQRLGVPDSTHLVPRPETPRQRRWF